MKNTLIYIFEAIAFIWTLSLVLKLLDYWKLDYDMIRVAILLVVIWIAGKMILGRYLIKLEKKNK